MSKPKPIHAPMTQFEVRDNTLIIGDTPLPELAARMGHTPFYAYDRAAIARRVAELRQALPPEIHIHYAIKANPMPELVEYMAGLVDGFDLASVGEMRVALKSSMAAEQISFAGPGKTSAELKDAIEAGVTINMESVAEMERINAIAEAGSARPRVAIRVNPDFELKSSGMKMGGGPKQFGVDAEQVPAMLKQLAGFDLEFMGFHIFSGSQNLRPEAIIEAHDKTFELALRLAQDAPVPPPKLNIGGGLGIPYFPGEQRLELQPIRENLDRLLPGFKQQLPDTEIVMELGRYLVGEAGIYVCEVIERKMSRGQLFLITNGGMHHHLAASGNFGQVIRKNYPVLVGNRVDSDDKEIATVVGPLCTPLDILADKMELPRADAGDLIVVLQSGAYGYSASPMKFLSHPEPREVLV